MKKKSATLFSNCPWEEGSKSVLLPLGKRVNGRQPVGPYNKATKNLKPSKTNAIMVFEETRDGLPKAYIPNFFYRAPFGYPRYKDLNYYRQLAASIYVDMCVTAIIDEVCSVEWDIVAEDRAGNEVPGKEKDIEKIQDFFHNPNTNKESWEMIVRMMLPDLLELNSGIMVKIFNMFGEMVEICARDGCLPYNSYIETDRGTLRIGEIVKNKLEVKVKSVNLETKEIEYKPVVNWFRNGTTTEWLKLYSISNSKHRNLTCTPNHKIYTKEGYKLAGDLKVGDTLYTTKEKLSKDEEQLIIGSILGDAHINRRQRPSFSETHTIKQKEYLLYKKESLERFNPTYREFSSRYDKDHKETPKCAIETNANIIFKKFRDLKYPELKKEIFDLLDLRGLAIWIQDDGHYAKHKSIELATHCFEKETLEYAQKKLKENFGYESKIRKDNRFEDSWILSFNVENAKKVVADIKEFIHPSMAYKVGLTKEEVGNNIEISEGTGTELEEVELEKIEKVENYDTKYDIEVEGNHNYFSHGKLISNSAFTKNPDPYGFYTNRADLILIKNILGESEEQTQQMDYPAIQAEMTAAEAEQEGAYFQYGFNTGARPIPFGRREIVWFEKKVRTDNLYGRSAMEVLSKTVQTLIYAVESQLEYFNDNSIPPGVLGLEGMSSTDLLAFGQQWIQQQKVQDDLGNWKRANHKLPMVNKMPKFERLGFTNQELELIESQKWWSKLVWGAFGITATELGFTEDAKGAANQIVQTSVAKKRIIYPLLRLIEYHVNTEIIPEFGVEGVRYKYKIFDVDEETKKWGLYKLQTESDLKTINEVRNAEGLDEVEWGDKNSGERSPQLGTNINLGDPRQQDADKINRDSQNTRDKMTGKPKGEKPKDIKKAQTTDSPTVLNPGEEMSSEKKLKKRITDLLKSNKEKVFDLLDDQGKPETLLQIKGIDDIPAIIKKIFEIFTFKKVVDEVISFKFNFGWEKSEKQIDQNIPMNNKALEFLQEHTFDNIKDMTEEISNKLKAELSRGIINGESIPKLKKRVSKVFDVGDVRASAIARTEVARSENQGKLLAMKESGLKMDKQWVATNDDRTCELCKHLDGQTVGLDDNFDYGNWSGQVAPSHPNCRCTLIFIEDNKDNTF